MTEEQIVAAAKAIRDVEDSDELYTEFLVHARAALAAAERVAGILTQEQYENELAKIKEIWRKMGAEQTE